MQQIVDQKQMKELERYTIEEIGVSSIVLMERAALAVVEELKAHFDHRGFLWYVVREIMEATGLQQPESFIRRDIPFPYF